MEKIIFGVLFSLLSCSAMAIEKSTDVQNLYSNSELLNLTSGVLKSTVINDKTFDDGRIGATNCLLRISNDLGYLHKRLANILKESSIA